MKIRLWKNFSKKNNSTKLPPTTAGSYKEIDAVLKTDTSLMNPVFLISSTNADYTTNYVAFENRYYFVSDIVRGIQDVLELHCTLDVLATYKGDITGSSQFVLYDTTGNTEIIDSRLSTNKTETVAKNSVNIPKISDAGMYILAHTSMDEVSFTVTTEAYVKTLLNGYSNWLDAQTGNDIGQILQNLVSSGDIASNIRSLKWVPWSISFGSAVQISLGAYLTNSYGRTISGMLDVSSVSVAIPWQFNDWRRCEPFTQLYLYIPFVGMVQLSSSAITSETTLTIKISLNQYTGDVAYEVYAGNQIIGTYGASTGVDLPIGATGITPMQAITSITGGIGSAVTGNIGGVANSVVNGLTPHSTTAGGIGSGAGAGLDKDIVVYSVCHDTNVAPSSVSPIMGTPTMAYKSLSGLSGYVQCNDASIDIAGCDQEKVQVETFLNSGIFIE